MATLLLLGLASSAILQCWADHQPCRDTRQGDWGQVTLADFGRPPHLNVTCIWSHSAANKKKLLVRVDNVHLPSEDLRSSSLTLVLDDQVVDIPRNCVQCLKQNFLSASVVELVYKSVLTEGFTVDDSPSDEATSELGSFQVSYKSFDPARCDNPTTPVNGFASVSGLRLGKQVMYGCDPPYDAAGPDKAVCGIKDELESPVPEWTFGPPKCEVTNCSSTVYRSVGFGALTSPGYPLYTIPQALECRWVLQADQEGHIKLAITFLQLSVKSDSFGTLTVSDQSGQQLGSYSTTSQKSISLVTNSSEVVINLATNNTDTVKGGFYMEYQLLKTSCGEPAEPDFGQVLFTSLTVGSTVNYRCLPGYTLLGETMSLCQNNGTWSAAVPTCVPDLDIASQDLSNEDNLLSSTSITDANASVVTLNSLEPKMTKPTRKSKAKLSEKNQKSTAKSKPSDSTKSVETSSIEVSGSGDGDDDSLPDDQKSDGKQPHAVNSAQDKVTKLKIKGNSTLVKQKPQPGVVQANLDPEGPFPNSEKEEKLLDVLEEEEEAREQEVLGLKSYIIIGVTSALLLLVIVLVVAMVVYRKRFPVRMGFGRRFSTFENPIYASKDVQHTRELKRLTV